jgi:hypothetical protein
MLNQDMSRRATSPVLVGREQQMGALTAAFEAVRQGGPVMADRDTTATVLVGGEAGAGKTRLVTEFAVTADATVLVGHCMELGPEGLPFAPFTEMLREIVRTRGTAVFGAGSSGGIRALARLLPELPAEQATDPKRDRAQLFEAFLSLFERLAAQRPLILVVEDTHWADRSSRDLLTFLIRYQRSLPNVLVIVTFRFDELHRTHPMRPLLAELARIDWVERLDLDRLTREQAAELAAAILGEAPDPRRIEAVYARAEGNPLFTEELIACPNADIPDSLRDLLLASVARLPEDTQEVLRVASASPGEFGYPLLATVTGLTDDALTSAIRPAVAANILLTCEDGYRFRHALIREAVHEDLLPGEDSRLHARFAEAIDANSSLSAKGRAEIEKAHHWNAAHDTTWALVSAWQAAAQAGRAIALAERLSLLTRVLELWDQVPGAADLIGADHVRVLEEAADAAMDSAEDQRAIPLLNAALAELDQQADPVRAALLVDRRQKARFHLGILSDIDEALQMLPDDAPLAARTQILLSTARCGTYGRGRSSARGRRRPSRTPGRPAISPARPRPRSRWRWYRPTPVRSPEKAPNNLFCLTTLATSPGKRTPLARCYGPRSPSRTCCAARARRRWRSPGPAWKTRNATGSAGRRAHSSRSMSPSPCTTSGNGRRHPRWCGARCGSRRAR